MSVLLGTTTNNNTYLASNAQRILRTTDGKLVAIVNLGTISPTNLCYQVSIDDGVTWGSAIQIVNTGARFYNTCIDSDNNIYILYYNNINSRGSVIKLTYSVGTWSIGVECIVWNSLNSIFDCSVIRKTISGRLFACSVNGTNNLNVSYSDNDGVNWTTINPSQLSSHIDACVIGETLHVFTCSYLYYTEVKELIYTTSWSNVIVETNDLANQARYPVVAVDINNYIHLAWRYNSSSIVYKRYISSWDVVKTTIITANIRPSTRLDIGILANNIVIVIYGGETNTAYYIKRVGETWDALGTILDTGISLNRISCLNISTDGILRTLHQDEIGSPYDTRYSFVDLGTDVIKSDTLSLSDNIIVNLSLEKAILEDTILLIDDCNRKEILLEDSIVVVDEIELNVSLEKQELSDTLSLSDTIQFELQETRDLINDFRMCKQQFGNIENKFVFCRQVLNNLSNLISIVSSVIIKNLTNKINTKRQEIYNLKNDIRTRKSFQIPSPHITSLSSTIGQIGDSRIITGTNFGAIQGFVKFDTTIAVITNWTNISITCLVPSLANGRYNVTVTNNIGISNYISFGIYTTTPPIIPPQTPPPTVENAGVQSLGKSYIKVYINSIEQTDANIDSISISKGLNSAHTAVFELARPYDSTKPDMESEVEIKYHIWTLYKGYITQINPTDNPEHIKINCQDKYWKDNQENVYFHVGHKPKDETELYYNTIKEGLAVCGINFNIGNFIPQTIDIFGSGKSDAITNLTEQSGNFSWYYDITETPKLKIDGNGDIINLEVQEFGENLKLYQILNHTIRNDVENIVNKYRVQMGEKVIRRFNSQGGTKQFSGYNHRYFWCYAVPAWDSRYEVLSKNSSTGYGFDHHKTEDNELYKDVFKKYSIPELDRSLESYSDWQPPKISVAQSRYGWEKEEFNDGFTIDYEHRLLIFNEPQYFFIEDGTGVKIGLRRSNIELELFKKQYYSYTNTPTENPETDISNPLMFFTDKIGDYSKTIIKDLNLTNLSIQVGAIRQIPNPDIPIKLKFKFEANKWYKWTVQNPQWVYITNAEHSALLTVKEIIPSWNDTNFAKDYTDWQLSKDCDEKINGNIEITLDALCYYGIDLSKRIMINNILNNPLNIESININISSFTVSIQLQNKRYYSRSVSIPSRGE